MSELPEESIELVVTSPPYPMIKMWDPIFINQNKSIGQYLKKYDGQRAFELMHQELDRVWTELFRVLVPGGIVCINIGDATRNLNGHFSLYPNHARILHTMGQIGFTSLPTIIWHKQTNAPNKFMGSGMLPAGAYVTLEHEHILILRKGKKREFTMPQEKKMRKESAYFWEERNQWFSDIWHDLKGARQELGDSNVRKRSAAFPFELPYRLICMYSVKGDTVLDPFLGVGTSMYAAIAAGRNSVGYEIDPQLAEPIASRLTGLKSFSNARITNRVENHLRFIQKRSIQNGKPKHTNEHYGFSVMTKQEKEMRLNWVQSIDQKSPTYVEVTYQDTPQTELGNGWQPDESFDSSLKRSQRHTPPAKPKQDNHKQQRLFPD